MKFPRLHYEWMYLVGRHPWDTNITPPEVMEFLESAPPGRALDLGCGTGTNAITMTQFGWQVTGVDFSLKAIRTARRKTSRSGFKIEFIVNDVSNLDNLAGPYDYALDIGCLHSIDNGKRGNYASGLARLVRPGGHYMLYAWHPRDWNKRTTGLTMEQVAGLFAPAFEMIRTTSGQDQGASSAWYWLRRV